MGTSRYTKSRFKDRVWRIDGGNLKIRAIVVVSDFILINLLMLIFLYGDIIEVPPYFDRATKVTVAVMNFSMVIAQYFYHTVIDLRIISRMELVKNVTKLVAAHVIVMGVFLRFLNSSGGMFHFMGIFAITEYVVILAARFIQRAFIDNRRTHGRNNRKVVFIGSDPVIKYIYSKFTETPAGGYHVVGYYADHRIDGEPEGLTWLGDMATLNRRLQQWNDDVMHEPDVDDVFCSLSHDEEKEIRFIMYACDRNIIHFFYVPRTFGNEKLRLRPVMMGDYVYYSNHFQPLFEPANRVEKRLFDICFSFVVCLFLIPITFIVGLIIKLQSPGPVFFKQMRTGLDGKDFYVYKYRSMHVNKDADTVQATKNDPRKFAFGDFMRKTNIDELPQFFNVLKGDMSVVGPRPHMLHHTEMYGRLIDDYMVRLFCKPGITGLAQVTGCRGETKELWQMEERVKRDIWYVEHWSMKLDLQIIWRTFKMFFVPDKNAF